MVNLRAMLLSTVTGLGHVYLRHYVLGAFLFALFATSLNGVFLGYVMESNKNLAEVLLNASIPCAIVVWLAGMVHAWKISYGTDRERLRAERSRLFRDGLLAYLRDDLDAAARHLENVVERDVDWEDTDALFHLGVVELRRAERHEARSEHRAAAACQRRGLRAFRACLRRDDRQKWRGEIALERDRAQVPQRKPILPPLRGRISTESSGERAIASLAIAADATTTTTTSPPTGRENAP